jgi:AcrR family transcriptional regulator
MSASVAKSHKISSMSRLTRTPKNKPQARTEITKAKILDAAQSFFSELGFENTQLDEVAARAGCSRGAIYAHYASKEELFLELMNQRVHSKFVKMRSELEFEKNVAERPGIFKRWISSQVCDPSWGTLTLEFKLYAVRSSEKREKLLNLYEALFKDATSNFVELLFGNGLTKVERIAAERRLAILGGAISGVILESHFRPALLPAKHLRHLIEELFDRLIHT